MIEPISTSIGTLKTFLETIKVLDSALTDKDAEVYRTFLIELSDYASLTSDMEAEYAGKVIDSIKRLRQLITKTALALPSNSKLVGVFFVLGGIVRHFLSRVDRIELSIRHQLELVELNPSSDLSRTEFLDKWKRLGYPDKVLHGNPGLNVMQIQWPLHQIQFIQAIGELRGSFGLALEVLCEATHIELPPPLAALTPEIEELVT